MTEKGRANTLSTLFLAKRDAKGGDKKQVYFFIAIFL